MQPLLEFGRDGVTRTRDAWGRLEDELELSKEERGLRTPDGNEPLLYNRIHWAVTYLVKAGLLERPQRGHFVATKEGLHVLDAGQVVNNKLLKKYKSFQEFTKPQVTDSNEAKGRSVGATADDLKTPEERIEAALSEISAALETEVLERVLALAPEQFEQLIVDLMLAMGYGAGGDGRRIGQSGDGGVDGIISEDKLGLDVVYLQAKRYAPENGIGSGQIREFIGSLAIKRVAKGVFVTTSRFSKSAREEAEQAGQRLVLIDGEHLSRLMIQFDVGTRTASRVNIKEIDLNYFEEF